DSAYVRNFIKESKADFLIHTAWSMGQDYKNSSDNLDWVGASLNLVKGFYEAGGQRAITVGSCFEYDLTTYYNGIFHELAVPRKSPTTLYGTSKVSMYHLLKSYTNT